MSDASRNTVWLPWVALGVLVAILLVLPHGLTERPFELRMLTIMFLYAAMGQGWNILGGYAGQTSIGHGVFFGLGAYASMVAMRELGVSPWAGIVWAAAVAGGAGVLIGLPCFRLKGHYFVIATLVVAESAYLLFTSWEWVGGAMGLNLSLAEPSLATLQFHDNRIPYYYLNLAFLTLVTGTLAILQRTKLGFVWRAIRDDQDAVRTLGFSPLRFKLISMAISAAVVGISGALYLQYVLYIDPASVLGLQLSVVIALIPILGGIATLSGPIVGAVILVSVSEYSRVYFSGSGRNLDLMIYGLLIMVISVYRPSGVISLLDTQRVRSLLARAGLAAPQRPGPHAQVPGAGPTVERTDEA